MNPATCEVLASVFPLLLITMVLERRGISIQLRRRRFVRRFLLAGVSMSLIGTALAVVGVQLGGYAPTTAVLLWTVAAIAFVSFGMSIVAIVATDEIDEDAESIE